MTIIWIPTLLELEAAVSGVAGAVVTRAGSGYTLPPTATIDAPPPGGIQATAVAVMSVSAVNVTRGGGGYLTVPRVDFLPFDGGSGATGTVQLNPFGIATVLPTNPGIGYTAPPTVQFSGGGGSGAQATAQLSGGQLLSPVTITNGGSGYTSPPTVTFVGGSGAGASATATIASSGAYDPTTVAFGTHGSGYNYPPAVIQGATSSEVAPVIKAEMSGSGIVSVTLNANSGYDNAVTSYPYVGIDPPPPGGTQAVGVAILTLDGAGPDYSITGIQFTGSYPPGLTGPPLTPGAGYVDPPNITIDSPWWGGSFVQAVATSLLSQTVTGLFFVSTGSGYTGTQTINIGSPASTGGSGVTATATCGVASNVVTGIQIQDAGSGYSGTIQVLITGGGGSGAAASVSAVPVGVSGYTVTEPGSGYVSLPEVLVSGGGGTGAAGRAVFAPTSVASVAVTAPGSGYILPPAVAITGGGGLDALASATLDVHAVDIVAGGYLYGANPAISNPEIVFTSLDGNGSGAAATLTLSLAVVGGEVFSLGQANALIAELADVGAQYDAGIPPVVRGVPTVYRAPPAVNWLEVDRATRYAASVSSAWFTWPASWAMPPSADPTVVMTQRAIPLYWALAVYPGTADPFFESTWLPLYYAALAQWEYLVAQQGVSGTSSTTPYADNSSLGQRLAALVAQAAEMTAYLTTP